MSQPTNEGAFFLTVEEDARIRTTVKAQLQQCRDLAGQAREPNDPRSAPGEATSAAFLADLTGGSQDEQTVPNGRPDAMVVVGVGSPYPPCTVSLRDLRPMKLDELRMNTHHRGRVLAVRRDVAVVRLVARSWTVVQEGGMPGHTERLEMYLHQSRHGEDVLEEESMFLVKEPYFTLSDQGEPTLRIDHPSDLVLSTNGFDDETLNLFNEDDNTAPASAAVPFAALGSKTVKQCKDEGNAALKQQALLQAHAKYSEGLRLATKDAAARQDDFANDISRNRAYVNLLLNRLDEAKADALAAVSGLDDQKHKDLDSKALFRAGCAAYNAGLYQEARKSFEEQINLTQGDKDALAMTRKIEMRLHEQVTGQYNFKKLKAALSKTRPRVDAASFDGRTEVRDSPGCGRGLFATHAIAAGEIILCEKAFCVVWGHEKEAWTAISYDVRDDRIRGAPVGLHKAIVQKLLDNPSQVERFMDLYGDYEGVGKKLVMADSRPVIDTFQVRDIVARNAFGVGPVDGDENTANASTGLWVRAAYVNHSCLSNTNKDHVGDLMILRASRPIAAGEEITHSYDESADYDARVAALENTWGFTCTCALCGAERADGAEVRKKRRELADEAEVLMARGTAAAASRLTITKVKRLARGMEGSYNGERYKELPRRALTSVQQWLGHATVR
ncbi:hypothetical protein LTR36_010495 [Oleoguttula mirabilis]|uniref:SET domain-containing protein n=1 Tax=Oleoguttula mirabilis TaxID=1507867 RepID=A0AAV9J4R4_9PEZI|nr:hypothetical protein LTR36_010495 [Oleoguttula mirabilis]